MSCGRWCGVYACHVVGGVVCMSCHVVGGVVCMSCHVVGGVVCMHVMW